MRDYEWVIGCDGAHSGVRQALGTAFEGGSYKGYFYVADIQPDGKRKDEFAANLEKGSFILTLPVRNDNGVRIIGLDQEERNDVSFADLQPEIERLIGIKVERLNWFSVYKVHHRVVDRFRNGRVFLAGDAAHIHSPAGGQGMNTGIGDAVNLAWKLAAVVKDGVKPDILDSYDAERRPSALRLVQTTDSAFRLVVSKGVIGWTLRSIHLPHIAPRIMRISRIRRMLFKLVSQIAISYRASPLSQGRAGALQAGDRLSLCEVPDNYAPLSTLGWHVQIYGQCSVSFRETFGREQRCAYRNSLD